MKIVEIIPQLSSGGAERLVVDLCNELSVNNDVTLIVYYDLSKYGFYINELSARVKLLSLSKKEGFSLSLFYRLRQEIKRINPDVVHLHTRAINYAFPLALSNTKIDFYMTIHSAAEKETGGFLGKLIRKICFKTNAVTPVAISAESLNSFKDFYGFSAPLIFNGRNIDEDYYASKKVEEECNAYKKTPSTRLLVSVARFTSVKRQDMLARVIVSLEAQGYDLCLLLIGRHLEQDVLDRVVVLGCDNIRILGEKDNPLDYLKLADAFCLCSSYEGMPISLIEAMGVGTIPVCTPVGGIVDVINESNGFLSDDISEEAYYMALKRFLDTDQAVLDDMRQRLIQAYKPYSMTECAARYETLFLQGKNEKDR